MTHRLRRLTASVFTAAVVSGVSIGLLAASAPAAPLTAGNIVVEQLTGTSGSSTAINVQEYTLTGSSVQTIAFPSSGASQQTDSASATSNGYLNSYNGYLSVPGQNLAAGTASAAASNTKVNSILDGSGSVVTRTLFPTGGPTGVPPSPFSGNNYRSSIATSGSTFYAVGTSSGSPNTGGAWYFDGTSFTQVSSTAATVSVTNLRGVEIYNNQLYFSSSSGTFLGVSSLGTGLPTTTANLPSLVINAGAGASTYGFVLFSTGSQGAGVLDLAYLADDRSGAGGGLQKYTFNGSNWTNAWTLLVGASGTSTLQSGTGAGFAGLRGLTGTWNATTGATLFATTTESSNNRLISILDTGLTTPSTYTQLQSAGTNQVFRGVDVVTVPEPTSLAALGCAAALSALLLRRRRAA